MFPHNGTVPAAGLWVGTWTDGHPRDGLSSSEGGSIRSGAAICIRVPICHPFKLHAQAEPDVKRPRSQGSNKAGPRKIRMWGRGRAAWGWTG